MNHSNEVQDDGSVIVTGGGDTYRLVLATPEEHGWLSVQDAKAFAPWPSASAAELAEVADTGSVLVLRAEDDGRMLGCVQVVLEKTPTNGLDSDEAYCFGAFVVAGERGADRPSGGSKVVRVLHNAQEALARAHGKTLMSLSVRPGNAPAVSAWLDAGFRVIDYDLAAFGPTASGGGRLMMRKSLSVDAEGFALDEHLERVENGTAARCTAAGAASLCGVVNEIAVTIARELADHAAQIDAEIQLISAARVLLDAGYIGVGWVPANSGEAGALVYRRQGLPPTRRPRRVSVDSEVGRLRDVLVNYDSFVGKITEDSAINVVASANVGRTDALAEVAEYRDFTAALQGSGVRLLRSNGRSSHGRLSRFPRDPSFVIGNVVVLGHMEAKTRHPEMSAHAQIFAGLNQRDTRTMPELRIEGGDVFVAAPDWLIIGICTNPENVRTNAAGAVQSEQWFPEVTVTRVQHEALHLDVLFSFASRNVAVVYREGLPAEFITELEQRGYTLVDCDKDEQGTMGCNLLAIDDGVVIAHAGNAKVNAELRKHITEVIEVDLSNIVKHGGGPRCMTCPIWREPDTGDWFTNSELSERITAIREPHHHEDVLSYLIRGDDGAVLIDTGMGYGDIIAHIRATITKLPITAVLTHSHFDHIGGTATVPRVLLFDDPWEIAQLEQGFLSTCIDELSARDQFTHPRFDPRLYEVRGRGDAELAREGEERTIHGVRLKFVHTPGHSPGSMSILLPDDRVIAVGDLLYDGPLYANLPESDPVKYRSSLERLQTLHAGGAFDVMLPGHNDTEMPPTMIDRAIALFDRHAAGEVIDGEVVESPPSRLRLLVKP